MFRLFLVHNFYLQNLEAVTHVTAAAAAVTASSCPVRGGGPRAHTRTPNVIRTFTTLSHHEQEPRGPTTPGRHPSPRGCTKNDQNTAFFNATRRNHHSSRVCICDSEQLRAQRDAPKQQK
ncbi:hypothetical protein EVAR_22493_1 [Eumeta japonica]|uniref:Secreted protein n=1 Tax=Eumeta variegata TaxID=151549 RepID=A0A4C1VBY1_EUMVA|nr:hypothetical protein EVAR_22493_1 [Eumeta japonica]